MILALPLFERSGSEERDLDRLAELVRHHGAEEVLFGLPYRLDGTEGSAAERVRAFGEALELRISVPVTYWDERHTSDEARRRLREVTLSRKRKRQVVNIAAAQVILESYLEATEGRAS
jgi:putative Holliday junction resolvase